MAEAAVGADPDVATRILEQRARAEVAESVAHAVVGESLLPPAADPLVGGDPNAAVAALQEGTNEIIDQSLFGCVLNETVSNLVVDAAAFRSDPERAFAITEDVANSDARDAGKGVKI